MSFIFFHGIETGAGWQPQDPVLSTLSLFLAQDERGTYDDDVTD